MGWYKFTKNGQPWLKDDLTGQEIPATPENLQRVQGDTSPASQATGRGMAPQGDPTAIFRQQMAMPRVSIQSNIGDVPSQLGISEDYRGSLQPPRPPPPVPMAPASRPGPDLRLAEPFTPTSSAGREEISPELRDKAYQYATGMVRNGPTPPDLGQAAMSAQPPAPDSAMSFARRYQDATQNERQAMIALGIGRDINQSMSTALTTGAHIRTGAKPPQFGTGLGEAVAMNAQGERQDLMTNESLDPSSQLSQSTRAAYLSIDPDLKKMDPKIFNSMSHAQLTELAPLMGKVQDRQLREAQIGNLNAQRQILNQNRRESLDMAKDKMSQYKPAEEQRLNNATDVLKELRFIEEKMRPEIIGPLAGRWTKIMTGLGLASKEEASLSSAILYHTQVLKGLLGGVRAQASPELSKMLEGLTPELYQNPAAFQAIIDTVRRQAEDDKATILDFAKTQGRTKGSEELRVNPSSSSGGGSDALRQKLNPGEILVKDKASGQIGALPEDEFDDALYERQ